MDERIKLYDAHDAEGAYYIPTKKAIFIPGIFIIRPAHEIAHMVEMNDINRCVKPDWGMTLKHNVNPRLYFSSLAREVRTRAIESIISDEKFTLGSTSFNIFNNPSWRYDMRNNLPFGRFKKENEVQDWVDDIRDRVLKSWSKDRIVNE
jgi:hypothetical protein